MTRELDSRLRGNDREETRDPPPRHPQLDWGSSHKQTMSKQYYIYILASQRNGTLYIGVTNNLAKRIYEHKNNLVEGFTKKYHIHNLVYFEQTDNIRSAIEREKVLKKWNRNWKLDLIEKHNPDWKDLFKDINC